MKRIWIIIVITILLITTVVIENIYVSTTLDYLKSETLKIKNAILENETINTNEIMKMINTFDNAWIKKENILCLVVNHKDMEKISEQIEKLKVLTNQNKKEEAEYESALLYYYAESYEHIISASFQNIF